MNVVFFGSTTDSVLVLHKLHIFSKVSCVVTQPARPVGRKKVITPTPVTLWAKDHNVTELSFPSNTVSPWEYESEQTVIDTLQPIKTDLIVTASYGQKIPIPVIRDAKFGGLNVHPSLLPRWKGADPVPWAILAGDHQTGVTILTLSEKFDQGKIIAQKKVSIETNDESDPLRAKLFTIGADLLVSVLPGYLSGSLKGKTQEIATGFYARRFTRDDGFITWEIVQSAISGQDVSVDSRPGVFSLDLSHISLVVAKAMRALTPWPGLWTVFNGKRLKILACHVEELENKLILDSVQLEGKKPVSFKQFLLAHTPS